MIVRALGFVAAALAVAACGSQQTAAPCTGDQDCALEGGGRCLPSPLGTDACAYPDATCSSGYHWGDLVGGGLAGMCMGDGGGDAGVDASTSCVGRFAFAAGDEIWVVNDDGTDLHNVSVSSYFDDVPRWSPTGDRIAFISNRTGNPDVFVVDADGRNLVNLTQSTAVDATPVWSPSGGNIAYVRDSALWVMSADGSNQRQLTTGISIAPGQAPAWSPDGTRIAIADGGGTRSDIYIVDFTGGGPVQNITNSQAVDIDPVWSPSGTRIAFTSQSASGDDIFMMAPDGTAVTDLTITPSALEGPPAWDPDGLGIVFSSDRDAIGGELYRIAIADRGVHIRLTTSSTGESSPAPSPNGDKIAFHLTASGMSTIGIVDAKDGQGLVMLALSDAEFGAPSWAPACP